jgi:hypothetical protein
VDDYGQILSEEARARWNSGRLLLLSQIPAFLREHGVEAAELQGGRPLLTALRSDCADQLSFFQKPENSAVWATLPADLGGRLQASDVFRVSETTTPSPSNSIPFRFMPWFWAAFVKPLDSGKRRWLSDDRYSDYDEDRGPPPSAKEIKAEDIKNPGPGRPVEKQVVHASIEAWANRYGVELSRFEISSSNESRRVHVPTRRLAFETLDAADLKRIKIPLDIVLKLIAH